MDPCIHGEDPLDQKNADGRTAFQLYIVDLFAPHGTLLFMSANARQKNLVIFSYSLLISTFAKSLEIYSIVLKILF